jgi:hypothetical protein
MENREDKNQKPFKLEKLYSLKPVVKSLDQKASTNQNLDASIDRVVAKKPHPSSLVRDITEDDDGYHPYSDVQDSCPLFEKDPWR